LGEARQAAGVAEATEFRLRDVWDGMSPAARREALGRYWKAINVAPRRPEGGTPLKFIARGPLGPVELELGTGDA
jgi:hypothetical protein